MSSNNDIKATSIYFVLNAMQQQKHLTSIETLFQNNITFDQIL